MFYSKTITQISLSFLSHINKLWQSIRYTACILSIILTLLGTIHNLPLSAKTLLKDKIAFYQTLLYMNIRDLNIWRCFWVLLDIQFQCCRISSIRPRLNIQPNQEAYKIRLKFSSFIF